MAHTHRLRPLALAISTALGTASFVYAPLASSQAAPREATLPEVKVQGASPADDYAPGISTIGGRTPTAIRDIPQSVTIINRAVMDAQAASSLSDVLRSVPGITLGAAEGGTIGNNINLRGFSARTDIYMDGVRDRGQVYRDVFALDAVEVLKGPSSMMFGRGSTGGVINQVSKIPGLRARNEISFTAGTNGAVRTTADFNQPLSETSAFRVALMAQDVPSTRDVMENRDYGIAPSLRFGINTPTEVTINALLSHNHDMPDYGLPAVNGRPAPVDRHNFYGLTGDSTEQDVGQFGIRVTHKISPTLTLRNQLQHSQYQVAARESGPNNIGTVNALGVYTPLTNGNTNGNTTGLAPSQLFAGLGPHDRTIIDKSLYNQTDLIAKFDTGALKHQLILGLEVGKDYYSNQSYTRVNPALPVAAGVTNVFAIQNLADPNYFAAPSTIVSGTGNLARTTAYTIAPYVNDTIELSKQWKWVGGVRFDRYDSTITNTVSLPPSAGQTIDFTSVRTGLIFQPNDFASYYVSYGTSFNPSLEQLTLTSGQQSLDPEKNKSYEVGAKLDLLGGNLSVTPALFRVDKTNARAQTSPGVFELTGDIRVNGAEIGVAGKITPRWQVFGGYAYLDARIVSASPLDGTQGKIPANTPTSSSSLWTVYALTPEWEIGGGGTYMSDRYAANTDLVSAGNYVRYDATLAYRQPKYDLRLNVLNLTNRLNYEQLIPSDGGRSVPSIDRTVLVTLTHRF